jgi:hypothetical protein
MEELKREFKEGFEEGWALFWSPFIGAFEGIKTESNRPKATNWKQFIANGVRMFFAPLNGAISGFLKALKGLSK